MGKQTKELYKMFQQVLQKQLDQKAPENKPLSYIENEAILGADALKSRNYGELPGNAFLNFQMPSEQMKTREMQYNANQTGTFGLADNAGKSQATALASQYLRDKFARDSAQNFQNNIAGAGDVIRQQLTTAAGGRADANNAETGRQNALLGSIANMYQFKKSTNQAASSALIGGAIGAGASVLSSAFLPKPPK